MWLVHDFLDYSINYIFRIATADSADEQIFK